MVATCIMALKMHEAAFKMPEPGGGRVGALPVW
jgi:hypothetical protein